MMKMILSPLLEFNLLLRAIGRKGEGKGEMEGVDVNYGGGGSGQQRTGPFFRLIATLRFKRPRLELVATAATTARKSERVSPPRERVGAWSNEACVHARVCILTLVTNSLRPAWRSN